MMGWWLDQNCICLREEVLMCGIKPVTLRAICVVANGYLPISGMDTYFCICEVSEIKKAFSSCLESYVNSRSSTGGSLAWLAKRGWIFASNVFRLYYCTNKSVFCISSWDNSRNGSSKLLQFNNHGKVYVKKTDIGEHSNRCVCSTMNRISIII